MITLKTDIVVSAKDANLSPSPSPVAFAGGDVLCPAGALAQEVTLPPASANVPLPFPIGVTTAKLLVVVALNIADLIVNYGAESLTVPAGQPLFLYKVLVSDVSLSSVLGGKIGYTVGG